MLVTIVHLSDIHINDARDPVLTEADAIAAAAYQFLPESSYVFIVLSGDIAFSGQEHQYECAGRLLQEIQKLIRSEAECPVELILCPGNHDCDYRRETGARKAVITAISQGSKVDESVIKCCTEVQSAFREFRDSIELGDDVEFDDGLWRSSRFTIGEKAIVFDCVNDAWASSLDEGPGTLPFPVEVAHASHGDGRQASVRIVVMHHPVRWMAQPVYRDLRTRVRDLENIVITGHEHSGNAGIIDEAESGFSAFVEGGALQDSAGIANSAFNIIQIDTESGKLRVAGFKRQGSAYSSQGAGGWEIYRNLPVVPQHPFPITEAFENILEDPGAPILHPAGVKVLLSDIYVFPDLKERQAEEQKVRNYMTSSDLCDPDRIGAGLVLRGDSKAGKSSLLYQLYKNYHQRGLVPVLVSGKDIKRATPDEIDRQIQRAVEAQYGSERVERFGQLPRNKKVLLVDDFDASPIKSSSARSQLLQRLQARFDRMLLAVGELSELSEMTEGAAREQLVRMEHLSIQPFGYKLRAKLIRKWYQINGEFAASEADIIARCDHAERVIDEVMFATLIPSAPLYLITLLHSIEGGHEGDFKNSALGYYYQYLLIEGYARAGVDADQLTEILDYSGHLAWEFCKKRKTHLSDQELREFNRRFSERWHTISHGHRMETLVKARVLHRTGQDYSFRYPYTYFFLKGKYLSDFLLEGEVRNHIQHCCEHLYVRDNANTVLFLAHHTNDDYVINCIRNALTGMFCDRMPITFDGDTDVMETIIEDAPRLEYSGQSPSEFRERKAELQDQAHEEGDGLATQEEEGSELSLVAKLAMLFKTAEILGQIVKNEYSRVERVRRRELIADLFNGPLRALNDFCEYCRANPSAIAAEIEAAIERRGEIDDKNERARIARKTAAALVQMVNASFLMKAARAVNADTLYEDVNATVQQTGTTAFRLIELCIHLDSPQAIPKALLEPIHRDTEGNLVARRVMQLMILHRLYMFKTTEEDMQWLEGKIHINLGTQHRITHQRREQRRNR